MKKDEKTWIKEITSFLLIGIFFSIILPLGIGFIARGFSESLIEGKPLSVGALLTTFMIYYIWILAGLIGIPILKIREMLTVKKGEDVSHQTKPSLFAVSILADVSQDSALWNFFKKVLKFSDEKNPMRFSKSMLRMFFISVIFFGFLCILKTFTSIPTINMQVTNTMRVLFSAEPASFAETTLMIFILSSLLGVNAYLCSKFKAPSWVYWMFAITLIPLLIGGSWMGIHNVAFGNSEVDLFTTFIFGWVGSLLTVLFGNWIIWWVWHFLNNIFTMVKELYPANESVMLIFWSLWAFILISYIAIEIWLYTIRKKKRITYYEK
jgi:hypothetical protein